MNTDASCNGPCIGAETASHQPPEGGRGLRRNMGLLDRTLRFVVGAALIPVGLVALSGWQGNLIGVLVAAFALIPLVTSLTGFCPAYVPFGISTIGGAQRTGVRDPEATITAGA